MSFYIVEKIDQLNELPIYDECFVYVIPLNIFYHPKLTLPCLIYYRSLAGKGHIICVDHSESFNIELKDVSNFINKHKNIFTLDSKQHLYFLPEVKTHDINFNLSKPLIINDYNTSVHNYFYSEFKYNNELEKIIPITKQFEKFENVFDKIKTYFYKNNTYNNETVNVFFNIENYGIQIDPTVFFKYFEPSHESASIKNNVIYTHYNLYNTTTRPTNIFNSVNFSALTKDSRESFIPSNDILVEFDYEGYHPRLIANEISYEFDISKSIYEQLSELYFGEVSDEYIKLSKEYTFKQLYGGIDERYLNIEYFKLINNWIDEEYMEYRACDSEGNFIENYFGLFGGKKVENRELSKNQLFSYLVQSLETYTNVNIMSKIIPLLEGKKSKLIMYNYDAFIFDVSKDEIDLIKNIHKIISEKFPVRISHGNNYKNMERTQIF